MERFLAVVALAALAGCGGDSPPSAPSSDPSADPGDVALYETFDSHYAGPGWRCGSGAVFDLHSNALRPSGWTSADAAGLPILPGLVRRDEVKLGAIRHALRFTTRRTQRAYVGPATHFASSSTDPDLPPMGLRVRLKGSFDVSRFRGDARVILAALQRYGMLLADNGSDWFVTGEANTAWDDDDLEQLKTVPGSAFEAVQAGPLQR
jgi:predicted small lipoprotein YifL